MFSKTTKMKGTKWNNTYPENNHSVEYTFLSPDKTEKK